MGLPPLEHLGPTGLGLLDEKKLHVMTCRQLGALFWMQLDARILPKLLADYYHLGQQQQQQPHSNDHDAAPSNREDTSKVRTHTHTHAHTHTHTHAHHGPTETGFPD